MARKMTKRQAKRLLNVALSVEQSKNPKAFSMNFFLYGNGDDPNGEDNWCGTPACALGHYGSRRDLQRVIRVGIQGPGPAWGTPGQPILCFNNNLSVEYSSPKICKHFGITRQQAERLFSTSGCEGARTVTQAANYIRKFVAEHYGEVK